MSNQIDLDLQLEESINQNGFLDAILDYVSSDYTEIPSPKNEEEEGQPLPLTIDMYGTKFTVSTNNEIEEGDQSVPRNMGESEEKLVNNNNNNNNNHGVSPLFTPHVSVKTPILVDYSKEEQIEYLEAMLFQTTTGNSTFTSLLQSDNNEDEQDEDDEEENNIRMVENIFTNTNTNSNENVQEIVSPYAVNNNKNENNEIKLEEAERNETTTLDERNCESFAANHTRAHNLVSDDDLMSMSVRELNSVLRKFPRDTRQVLKQRRRLLKNRGYAQKCRIRRVMTQKQYSEENTRLKEMLQHVTSERNVYKAKYENLKAVIRKARLSYKQRKTLEHDVLQL